MRRNGWRGRIGGAERCTPRMDSISLRRIKFLFDLGVEEADITCCDKQDECRDYKIGFMALVTSQDGHSFRFEST